MSPVTDKSFPRARGIPYLHHLVSTYRGNARPIRRPRHCFYKISMALVGDEGRLAKPGIPHLYRPVIAGRGDAFAVRRPCCREDRSNMAGVCEKSRASSRDTGRCNKSSWSSTTSRRYVPYPPTTGDDCDRSYTQSEQFPS